MARIVKITTRRTSHPTSGAGRIIARGAGRQYTHPIDHARPMGERAHDAAREFARRTMGEGAMVHEITSTDDGGRRTFLAVVGERREHADADRLARQARRMLADHGHDIRTADTLTRENCGACVLNGYGDAETDRYRPHVSPNYAGWARVYVQARRVVPMRYRAAFDAALAETGDDGRPTPYALALADDVATFGVVYGL